MVSPQKDGGHVPMLLPSTALAAAVPLPRSHAGRWGHLGSVSAMLSLKMAVPRELSLLQQCLLEELFVPL